MPRRSNGEGSVLQRKDGRWQGSLRAGGKRLCVYGKTRSETVERLHKLTEQVRQSGRLPTNPSMTVE
ncbi:MAG: site-specific integrase, partial [Chloroflexi bacterium]|nr:site-specific integrase [Chloroflexota bacterium]